jgi:hypothetical protein
MHTPFSKDDRFDLFQALAPLQYPGRETSLYRHCTTAVVFLQEGSGQDAQKLERLPKRTGKICEKRLQ